jgi:PTH1 family peptidyl-tRNA hydrolase
VRIIFGVGNPGSGYQLNRHNAGFLLTDFFAKHKLLNFTFSRFDYQYSEGEIDRNPFALVKPSTFVNLSGIALKQCCEHYKVSTENILILVDDINLSNAEIRIRKSGSDGGHNGLKSIIYQMNTDEIPRLRIGVGSNFDKGFLSDYVLTNFSELEFSQLIKSFEFSSQLIESFITGGYDKMLFTYSQLKNQNNKSKETE